MPNINYPNYLTADASNNLAVSGYFAANGKTPVATQTYTMTNALVSRSFDRSVVSVQQLADVTSTLIGDLRAEGLVS